MNQTSTTQTMTASNADVPNMGRAPKEVNGVGRLDLRVYDETGAPIDAAYAVLESRRTDGYYCEAYGATDRRGVFPMPALHMGELTLKVTAKGFEPSTTSVLRESLSEPVVVRLTRKR